MIQHFARLRSEVVEAVVRAQPDNSSEQVATMKRGDKLFTGGLVKGEKIAGVDRWRKVWYGGDEPGYVHWSVTWQK
jgi:hypothetical protein